MLNSHEPDPCCGKALSKALLSGSLDTADSYLCPKCGETWKPEIVGEVRFWRMHPLVAVLRV